MNEPWILVDVSYLAHRAYHSMKTADLRRGENPVGAVYGFLAEVKRLGERFGSRRFLFAFDSSKSLRRQKYSWYKNRAVTNDPKMLATKKAIYKQVQRLCDPILPAIGFQNCVTLDGYEADDVIYRAADEAHRLGRHAVMVSADEDLYQRISRRCVQYRPFNKEMVDLEEFRKRYEGIDPTDWPMVKALAGCKSDTVPGIPGVGEVYAARWVADVTIPSKQQKQIDEYVRANRHRPALEVVTLPFAGCPPVTLRDDDWTDHDWNIAVKELGMETLTREMQPSVGMNLSTSKSD